MKRAKPNAETQAARPERAVSDQLCKRLAEQFLSTHGLLDPNGARPWHPGRTKSQKYSIAQVEFFCCKYPGARAARVAWPPLREAVSSRCFAKIYWRERRELTASRNGYAAAWSPRKPSSRARRAPDYLQQQFFSRWATGW
jgi:hypothetical protein